MDATASLHGLTQELRRGTLVLAVLSELGRGGACGADLRERLAGHGLGIEEGVLYPMLRRLEAQGILGSERRMEGSRHKRIYSPTSAGQRVQLLLLAQWHQLGAGLAAILEEQRHDRDRNLLASRGALDAAGQ